MKTLNIYAALLFSIFAINFSFAQTFIKKETIKVWGNCGMCKNNIEKAAKVGGASSADWNEETKILNVSYNSSKSNSEKIQKSIAASGYDTQNFKAEDKAYNKLMPCCKYERNTTMVGKTKSNMPARMTGSDGACKNMECCKDKGCCDKNGTCNDKACKDMSECKTMSCCKS